MCVNTVSRPCLAGAPRRYGGSNRSRTRTHSGFVSSIKEAMSDSVHGRRDRFDHTEGQTEHEQSSTGSKSNTMRLEVRGDAALGLAAVDEREELLAARLVERRRLVGLEQLFPDRVGLPVRLR